MTVSRKQELKSRLCASFFATLTLITLLYCSTHALLRYGVAAVISTGIALAIWEFFKMTEKKGYQPSAAMGTAFTGIYAYVTFLSTQSDTWLIAPSIVLYAAILTFFLSHFSRKEGALTDIAMSTLGFAYIAITLSCILKILYSPTEGVLWCIYLISASKVTDVGGYCIGKLWGKNKLAPQLSPAKTIEGALAGFACSICTSILFSQYVLSNFTMTHALILGSALGIITQIGDLAESMLKRDAGIKDSNTLPGLGGMLDTVDSLIFTSPLVFLYLQVL